MLVFDGHDRLHLPLTTFAKEATRSLSSSSVRVYLYAGLPFFTFLDHSRSPGHARGGWNVEPEGGRQTVAEYLEEQLGCVIRRYRLGFELVSVTGRSRGNVGAFLAALKLFYNVMREIGCCRAENPLMDATSCALSDIEDDDFDTRGERPPRGGGAHPWDWANRGLTREATAISKGSHARRDKFFRFSSESSTLLRRYFDRERRSHDRNQWTLADYLRRAHHNLTALNDVLLFLSSRGTPMTAKSFRETYWTPACRAVGIDADPHQARHWYVTMAVRTTRRFGARSQTAVITNRARASEPGSATNR